MIGAYADSLLANRAIDIAGPTGSTIEPITALAALQSGAWLPGETFDDTGQFCINVECLRNAGHAVYGVLDLASAIRADSAVFFSTSERGLTQTRSRTPMAVRCNNGRGRSGSASRPGSTSPGEDAGTLPTPAWQVHQNALEQQCEDATGPYAGQRKDPVSSGGCGIAVLPAEPWTVGDNINLAVGQREVQITPLQLAVAYAAIANGGTILQPHLGLDIQSPNGTVLKTIDPSPLRHLDINSSALDASRAGPRGASALPGGTTARVFGNFPDQVYGEAGSGQRNGRQNDAWYAGYVFRSTRHRPRSSSS